MRKPSYLIALVVCLAAIVKPAQAAEKSFDFSDGLTNRLPEGFSSVLAGTGEPGQWKVMLEAVPSLLAPISPNAPVISKRPVAAQLSRDKTDERFPMLVYDEETFGDFSLSVRFTMVDGVADQMAGVAFRLQDEKNYYYVRASALGGHAGVFQDRGRSAERTGRDQDSHQQGRMARVDGGVQGNADSCGA